MLHDLFPENRVRLALDPGASLLGGFALPFAETLIAEIAKMAEISPFRRMETRGGKRMSVAMYNCGEFGWVSDRSGYRYTAIDPETERTWPPMPASFIMLSGIAAAAAGHVGFVPDACLVNRYVPGARLSLHRDSDEEDLISPIVSVSLGLPATFLWGGLSRCDRVRRHSLFHGDIVVWGGQSRMAFHGVEELRDGCHPTTGQIRLNLTFRKTR